VQFVDHPWQNGLAVLVLVVLLALAFIGVLPWLGIVMITVTLTGTLIGLYRNDRRRARHAAVKELCVRAH
jgi:hypothetical protein